jgi:hypothetical protein
VDNAGTRVSTLENCHSSITTAPQSATPLYVQNACEGHLGHLAAFPLIIQEYYGVLNRWNGTSGVDNIIAALEHNDRVCEIRLRHLTTTSELKYVTDSAAMFKPFPELTHLAPARRVCRR